MLYLDQQEKKLQSQTPCFSDKHDKNISYVPFLWLFWAVRRSFVPFFLRRLCHFFVPFFFCIDIFPVNYRIKMVFWRVVFLTSFVPFFSWRRVLTGKFAYKVAFLRMLFLMSFVRLCDGIGILPVNFRIKLALVCLHVDCVALPLRGPYALRSVSLR